MARYRCSVGHWVGAGHVVDVVSDTVQITGNTVLVVVDVIGYGCRRDDAVVVAIVVVVVRCNATARRVCCWAISGQKACLIHVVYTARMAIRNTASGIAGMPRTVGVCRLCLEAEIEIHQFWFMKILKSFRLSAELVELLLFLLGERKTIGRLVKVNEQVRE